jgi:hypothetical protein
MWESRRTQVYGPPRPVTGIALLGLASPDAKHEQKEQCSAFAYPQRRKEYITDADFIISLFDIVIKSVREIPEKGERHNDFSIR